MWLTHFWHSWSQFFIFAWDVTAEGILRTGVLICLVDHWIDDIRCWAQNWYSIGNTSVALSHLFVKGWQTNLVNLQRCLFTILVQNQSWEPKFWPLTLVSYFYDMFSEIWVHWCTLTPLDVKFHWVDMITIRWSQFQSVSKKTLKFFYFEGVGDLYWYPFDKRTSSINQVSKLRTNVGY